jgi:hypothetical protein
MASEHRDHLGSRPNKQTVAPPGGKSPNPHQGIPPEPSGTGGEASAGSSARLGVEGEVARRSAVAGFVQQLDEGCLD